MDYVPFYVLWREYPTSGYSAFFNDLLEAIEVGQKSKCVSWSIDKIEKNKVTPMAKRGTPPAPVNQAIKIAMEEE